MKEASPLPQLLTPEQAAEQTGIPIYTVYALAREHKLPCVRVGRTVRFLGNAIEAWISAGGTTSRSDPTSPPALDR